MVLFPTWKQSCNSVKKYVSGWVLVREDTEEVFTVSPLLLSFTASELSLELKKKPLGFIVLKNFFVKMICI